MSARIGWVLSRMTRGRWVLVGLIAVAPLAAVLLLLAGVAFGFTRVAAFIVAFLMLLALLGALLAGLWLRRRVRRVRAAAEGEAVDLSRPAGAAVLRRVGTPAAEAIDRVRQFIDVDDDTELAVWVYVVDLRGALAQRHRLNGRRLAAAAELPVDVRPFIADAVDVLRSAGRLENA